MPITSKIQRRLSKRSRKNLEYVFFVFHCKFFFTKKVYCLFPNLQYEPEWAEKAYRMGKYFYECGKYMQSISYLYFCSLVMQPTDKNYLNVLWGILAAEILQLNWNSALESMNRLRDYIDNSNFRYIQLLQN